jgi:hypothetical protein
LSERQKGAETERRNCGAGCFFRGLSKGVACKGPRITSASHVAQRLAVLSGLEIAPVASLSGAIFLKLFYFAAALAILINSLATSGCP